jgi:eukaryotic-like serine/threonine-protein kinase
MVRCAARRMLDSNDPLTRRLRARVGHTLRGKWKLDALLGVGGMACVYAATHRNGMRGAVKVLHVELSSDESTRTRFLREGYLANQVGHPGVVTVLDDDSTEDGAVYLVMELLEGETLSAVAASVPDKRLPIARVLEIADQLLDVLAAAHDKGIVHRDIKPDNLFWTRDGRLKVLDFGIARMHDAPGGGDATKTGNVLGTPAFMPPEQALGESKRVNALSDLWSAGATIFTLAAGRRVREAESTNKMLLAAMTQPAPAFASVVPDAEPALAALIDRSLAFEQADRYQDARAMQHAVRGIAAGLARRALAPSAPHEPSDAELTVTHVVTKQPAAPAALPGAAMPVASIALPTPPRSPSLAGPGFQLGAPLAGQILAAPAAPQSTASPLSRDVTLPRAPRPRVGIVVGVVAAVGLVGAVALTLLLARGDSATDPKIANAGTAEPAPTATAEPAPTATAEPAAPSATAAPSAPAEPAPSATAAPTATAEPAPAALPSTRGVKAPHRRRTKKDPLDRF